MTLPANIRLNVKTSFPTRVQGSGPITLTKANGVWTVGFSILPFATQTPPGANWPTDFLLGYDAFAKLYFKIPLSALGLSGARTQRSAVASPVVIGPTDQILNVNLGAPGTCALPLAAGRSGVPLTFKLLPGSAALTLNRTAPDTFDGVNTLPVVAGQTLTLMPYNDGVNAGYGIE